MIRDTIYLDPDPGVNECTYTVHRLTGGWRRVFPPEYVDVLRPIAETLAMMDGNAFFGNGFNAWIQYLPEADALYRANSCPTDVSWLGPDHRDDPTLQDAYDKYQALLALKNEK